MALPPTDLSSNATWLHMLAYTDTKDPIPHHMAITKLSYGDSQETEAWSASHLIG